MISQSAKEAFEFFAVRAVKTAFAASEGDRCEVLVVDQASQSDGQNVVLLTASSLLFRATTFVHFTMNQGLRHYLATINQSEVDGMSEGDVLDALGETTNILCGAFNRELGQYFPYLGMSTPNFLDRRCVDHLHDLGAGFTRHFKVVINDVLTMHVTLCVNEFADIDFHANTTDVEECNGELEMF
jgi:hypothetical protein